jgi:hypothetical protein
MIGGPELRASDAERERAVDTLRQHHTDGRLSSDEFEERMGRAYAATTRGDLDDLFDDLPPLRTPERERRHYRMWPPVPVFLIVATVVAIAVVGAAHGPWIVWPLMFVFFFRFLGPRHRWH